MYVKLAIQIYTEALANPFIGTFQKNRPYYEVTIAL